MFEPVEGNSYFEGLLEFNLTDQNDLSILYSWLDEARSLNVIFHLSEDGQRINILPQEKPYIKVNDSTGSDIFVSLIQSLSEKISQSAKTNLNSTLRCREFQFNKEIQTIIDTSNGEINIQTREINTATIAAKKPLILKDKIKFGVIISAAVLIVFFISSLFIDYKAAFSKAVYNPQNKEIEIENIDFYDYISIEIDEKHLDKMKISINIISSVYDLTHREKNNGTSALLIFFDNVNTIIKTTIIPISEFSNSNQLIMEILIDTRIVEKIKFVSF